MAGWSNTILPAHHPQLLWYTVCNSSYFPLYGTTLIYTLPSTPATHHRVTYDVRKITLWLAPIMWSFYNIYDNNNIKIVIYDNIISTDTLYNLISYFCIDENSYDYSLHEGIIQWVVDLHMRTNLSIILLCLVNIIMYIDIK